ncbi:universal stress protein [Haloarcula laminariae]|uniref:universal stress protein n=1 Tax=Haloarcula laminariae TaxID=2961577 RepID=UPI0024066083|nr:universal stress protein [Halomicroarcula sp. FL173]
MTRVLVPVAVLEGESVSPGLVDLLGTVDVTVLGYHVLPEQTPPDQARLQYEDRATDALEDLSDAFRTAGGAADHRLVFTHDRQQSIDRVADEVDAKALAVPGITGDVERILVSLSGDVAVDRILSFLTELVGDRDIGVTLLFAADTEDTAAERLDTAAEQLRSSGIDVTTTSVVGTGPFAALIEEASSHDAIVMSERAPSFSSLIFGEESDRIAAASVGPVLVVRYEEALDT